MKRLIIIAVLLGIIGLKHADFSKIPALAAAIDTKIEDILPKDIAKTGGGTALTSKNFKTEIIPALIKIFLALGGAISTIVFVYAGVMLVVSQGNEEELTKFKNILIWSLAGLTFIVISYALVRGILQLSFT